MIKTKIDINNWKGKKHYEWFKTYSNHSYSVTKEIEITKLLSYLNSCEKTSFFIALLYLITKSLNSIEEMRLRVINNEVYLYDIIHPAYTIMTDEEVFENCDNLYYEDYHKFYYATKEAINKIKKGVNDNPYNDFTEFNQFYMTCLPWISFTGMIHPMPNDDSSFVPRICWSKYYERNDKYYISLNINVSHALVDGYPLSKAFLKIEENINNPEQLNLLKK